jgi:hypothetical protein
LKLYTGTSEEFIQDILENKLSDKLKAAYEGYYYRLAGQQEVVSWTNSLQFVKNVVEYASLKDNMVVVEYELPYSNRRIDCLLFGKGPDDKGNAVIMELKQWSKVEDCDLENEVLTFTGGANRFEAHPSFQVQGYYSYLKDFVEVLGNDTLSLSAISYCHNYSRGSDVMFGPKFQSIMKDFPLFAKEDVADLATYLKARLSSGHGLEILDRFSSSPVGPTKKLLEHTSEMIKGQKVFNLLEDQLGVLCHPRPGQESLQAQSEVRYPGSGRPRNREVCHRFECHSRTLVKGPDGVPRDQGRRLSHPHFARLLELGRLPCSSTSTVSQRPKKTPSTSWCATRPTG